MKRKELPVEIEESSPTGGRITISTGALDRQNDRVLPGGMKAENYLKNPVVQWGHNYYDPWATIGETVSLERSENGIIAEFKLREPVNESDPQTIIKALWEQGLIRTASIGFNPVDGGYEENDAGGFDFTEWELLEWSLVPVPANQDALRLAVKGLDYGRGGYLPDIEGGVEWPSRELKDKVISFVLGRRDSQELISLRNGEWSDAQDEDQDEKREIELVWSCGYGHKHKTKEEAAACILEHQGEHERAEALLKQDVQDPDAGPDSSNDNDPTNDGDDTELGLDAETGAALKELIGALRDYLEDSNE